jgi:hypothetical protein
VRWKPTAGEGGWEKNWNNENEMWKENQKSHKEAESAVAPVSPIFIPSLRNRLPLQLQQENNCVPFYSTRQHFLVSLNTSASLYINKMRIV